jgi:hypothetical protein
LSMHLSPSRIFLKQFLHSFSCGTLSNCPNRRNIPFPISEIISTSLYRSIIYWLVTINRPDIRLKVRLSRCGPEGSMRFRLPDLKTFVTRKWWCCQPHAPDAFTPRKCSWYSFSLGVELTPGAWYSWKEYGTEKFSDTNRNWSWDRPTSSAAS